MRNQKQVLVRGQCLEIKSGSVTRAIPPPTVLSKKMSTSKHIWNMLGAYWLYVQFLDGVCLHKVKGRICIM